MMDVIEKLVGLFCLFVFVTFLANHGHIDFSGVDWVKEKTTEAITSEKGQQYVKETKEISESVFRKMFDGIKSLFIDDDNKETVTETYTESTEEVNEMSHYHSGILSSTLRKSFLSPSSPRILI